MFDICASFRRDFDVRHRAVPRKTIKRLFDVVACDFESRCITIQSLSVRTFVICFLLFIRSLLSNIGGKGTERSERRGENIPHGATQNKGNIQPMDPSG